jgi:hypothetical protein
MGIGIIIRQMIWFWFLIIKKLEWNCLDHEASLNHNHTSHILYSQLSTSIIKCRFSLAI